MTDPQSTDYVLGALTAEVARMKAQIDAISSDVREVHDAVIESRGGRRMGFAILTSVGMLGGFVGAFGHWLFFNAR